MLFNGIWIGHKKSNLCQYGNQKNHFDQMKWSKGLSIIQNPRKKEEECFIFRSILRGNTAFFAKFRRKLRTKNFEAHFNIKLRTLEKCSNVKKLRTAEP